MTYQRLIFCVILSLVLPLLISCGGTSSDDATSNAQQNSNSAPTSNVSTNPEAIASQTSMAVYSVEQFSQIDMFIDMEHARSVLSGHYLAIKVSDSMGNTYFSAIQQSPRNIDLTLSVPNAITALYINIYDELGNSAVSEEWSL